MNANWKWNILQFINIIIYHATGEHIIMLLVGFFGITLILIPQMRVEAFEKSLKTSEKRIKEPGQ